MKESEKKLYYLKNLYYNLLFPAIAYFVCIIFFIGVNINSNKLQYAKSNGFKTTATVIDIDETNNPLHDPYKEDRTIYSITLEYNYNGTQYTQETSSSYSMIRMDEQITIYILDNDPSNIVIEFPTDNNLTNYIIYASLVFIVCAFTYCLFLTIKEILLYKKAIKNFNDASAEFVRIDKKDFLGIQRYYVICKTNEFGNFEKELKSHVFSFDPTDIINKKKIRKFPVKYNPLNPEQYIINTNKLDK